MPRIAKLAALVAAFVFLAPLLTHAQAVNQIASFTCISEAAFKAAQDKFGERRIGAGVATDGTSLYEITVSKEGSFTMTRRDGNGMVCLIGGGIDWLHYEGPMTGEAL